MSNSIVRACEFCAQEFVARRQPKRGFSRFCSPGCSGKATGCITKPLPLETRFWSKVDKRGADECWPWSGRVNHDGYGMLDVGESSTGAHRIAYELAHGPISDGLSVCHHCDNPPCVNPAHLFLGTHLDNMRDMYRKKRRNSARGERHGVAKLTTAIVIEMRARYAAGERNFSALGRAYGVNASTVTRVVRRRWWAHVP